jgi:hypothetical protein
MLTAYHRAHSVMAPSASSAEGPLGSAQLGHAHLEGSFELSAELPRRRQNHRLRLPSQRRCEFTHRAPAPVMSTAGGAHRAQMLHLQKDAVRKAMKVSLQALSADALDSASTLFATLAVGRGSFWFLDLSK